ncbi:hypothetical protein [Pseudomonas cannabina]|uniref:hypothetical protein n=1 Tax=Pseudomonas cannabina TaxID=86840 RepID=UPI002226025A|nr:hypothetical protein [Pseudomonas cannabina]
MIAGQLAPASGIARHILRTHLIDQHAQTFDPEHSIEQVLRNELGTVEEGRFRQVFANAGLDARQMATPFGRLSGGERLRATLAWLAGGRPRTDATVAARRSEQSSRHRGAGSSRAVARTIQRRAHRECSRS